MNYIHISLECYVYKIYNILTEQHFNHYGYVKNRIFLFIIVLNFIFVSSHK